MASVDVARLLTASGGHDRTKDAAPTATTAPASLSTTVTVTAPAPPNGSAEGTVVPPPAKVTAGVSVVAPADEPPPLVTTTTVAASPVVCRSDLALEDSPDAPYNFLCIRAGIPISWPNDQIRLYVTGLKPEQTLALEAALAQWQQRGRFAVTRVTSPATANVTITNADLTSSEGGHATVHYTCSPNCAFDHADVRLSSTLTLADTLWVPTILHELGHVAGLSHVARASEVMYPEITKKSSAVYGSGDLAGFEELTKVRSAA